MKRFKKIKDTFRLYWWSITFFFGLREAEVYTHNVYKKYKDSSTKKTVRGILELVKYGKEIDEGNIRIDGKAVEYKKTMSVIDFNDNFFFVVLYKPV